MRPRTLWLIPIVLAFAFAAPALAAGSFRCGSRLVGTGDGIDHVVARCGAPTFRAVSTELVTYKVSSDVAVTRAVPVEEWTYNFGPNQFVRFLTFREGTLVRVEEGPYGF